MIPPINRFEICPTGSMNLLGRATNLKTDSFGNLYSTLNGKTVGKIDAIGRVNTFGGEFLGFSSGLNTVRLPLAKPYKSYDDDYYPPKKSFSYEKPSYNLIEKQEDTYKSFIPKLPEIKPIVRSEYNLPKIPKLNYFEKEEPTFKLYETKIPVYEIPKPKTWDFINIERDQVKSFTMKKKYCSKICYSCLDRLSCSDSNF